MSHVYGFLNFAKNSFQRRDRTPPIQLLPIHCNGADDVFPLLAKTSSLRAAFTVSSMHCKQQLWQPRIHWSLRMPPCVDTGCGDGCVTSCRQVDKCFKHSNSFPGFKSPKLFIIISHFLANRWTKLALSNQSIASFHVLSKFN